jgi:choline/glycine/proline betaine transport protein
VVGQRASPVNRGVELSRIGKRIEVNPPVFFTSGGLLIALLLVGVLFPERVAQIFPTVLDWVGSTFGWLYVASTALFVGFSFWLMASRFGSIRLGQDDERPTFSRLSWFAMLFSAGMGIGLVFYGVAEPIYHLGSAPAGVASGEVATRALPVTYFHWGIHAWSIYVLMGLGIAYFSFRKKLPLAIRSCLHPLLGDRIYGWPGHLVDILAVFGTLFGLATSLGLGAMQVSAGLHHVVGTPHTRDMQLVVIACITLAATLSLISGVNRGIRRLSELNMLLAATLLVFVLLLGPTAYIVERFGADLLGYGRELAVRTLGFHLLDGEDGQWSRSWTLFYWGWWIAWAPFVGMFVARVSRGRTIREFILGVMLVPTLLTFLWFGVFGNTALHLELYGPGGVAGAVNADVATAIYVMLEHLPYPGVTSLLAALVVAVFFVTSSDSASLVVDMLTSGGHPNPPIWQRVFWATAEGACAAVLLYAGGKTALQGLQAMVITIGLPFCLVLLGLMVSLVLALRKEN